MRTNGIFTTQPLSWRMTHTNSYETLTYNGSPNLSQKTRPHRNKKKRTGKNVDVAVQADHRIKLKENEKKYKYLDLAREF